MAKRETQQVVEPPVAATALLVDLRNFTPLLNASPEDTQCINTFCYFLTEIYAACVQSCLLALPAPQRNDPPLYINSTGDGVLVVYSGDWHFGYGFLAAILLDAHLGQRCAIFNHAAHAALQQGLPQTAFGIGVESGFVSRVRAQATNTAHGPAVEAYIGHCINVAARSETISKMLDAAYTIVADSTVELVGERLFRDNFTEKRRREAACTTDEERLIIHHEMNGLNHRLCLSYINRHLLKGVDKPMPLYRLARSALQLGTGRFEELVRRLVRDDSNHYDEVIAFLSHMANGIETGLS
jgi:class 3 adenylate cyclase